jgi:hypothetical protein
VRGGPLVNLPDEAADLGGMDEPGGHHGEGHQQRQDRAQPAHRRSVAASVGGDRDLKLTRRAGSATIAISTRGVVTIAAAIGVAAGEARALYASGGIAVLSLLWGVFNTWELIFRVQKLDPG